jgi:ribose transport system ATP-binding protein
VLGIAGLVGAGRSELLRSIFGLNPVRSGEIKVGKYSGFFDPSSRWKQGMGMLSEDRAREGLARNRSLVDNVTLPRLSGLGILGIVTRTRQNAACRPWFDRLAVKFRSFQQPVGDLSGGNQQKIALARMLHADVDIWLLDEPTRGIDVGSKTLIYELIDQLVSGSAAGGRAPRAVLMVSSYLPELLGVCDSIAVMHRGVLNEARPVSEWTEHEIMLQATGAAISA